MNIKEKIKNCKQNGGCDVKSELIRIGYCALGIGVGYFVGYNFANFKTDLGLARVFEATPGLKTAMQEGIDKVMNK